jgi:hypothetical protein
MVTENKKQRTRFGVTNLTQARRRIRLAQLVLLIEMLMQEHACFAFVQDGADRHKFTDTRIHGYTGIDGLSCKSHTNG